MSPVSLDVNAMPDQVQFLRTNSGSWNNRAGAGGRCRNSRNSHDRGGFKDVHVLRKSTRDSGRGDGRFRRVTRGSPDSNWVACVVGKV